MFPQIPLLTLDPTSDLGKIESALLPQQTLVELFISGMKENRITKHICDKQAESKDLSEWHRVERNAAAEIFDIYWAGTKGTTRDCGGPYLEGSLAFEWLPSTVEKLCLNRNALSGTVDLCRLSKKLIYFALAENNLSGSLNLENLPPCLENVYLDSNEFSGTVCLTKLPHALIACNISANRLSGAIYLTNLPKHMSYIDLNKNTFDLVTDFSMLPHSLRYISVNEMEMAGAIDAEGVYDLSVVSDSSSSEKDESD